MDSNLVKRLSYVAFGAGVASIAASGITYLFGRADNDDREKSAGHFIGLWAPTFFLLAEMIDRISVQDDSYMGIPIERRFAKEVTKRGRELTESR
jgi:hypothetical protein